MADPAKKIDLHPRNWQGNDFNVAGYQQRWVEIYSLEAIYRADTPPGPAIARFKAGFLMQHATTERSCLRGKRFSAHDWISNDADSLDFDLDNVAWLEE